MTPAVEAAGVELAYEETAGRDFSGPAVVLVHGTAGSRAGWREVVAELGGGVRAISYDRRAYGDSGAPEPYGGTTVGEQADDLAQLVRGLGAAPALAVGHELGALVCLDALLRHRELFAGAVLVEPPMLWLSKAGPDAVSALRDAVERGARDEGAAGAVSAYLEAVGGPHSLELLGDERAAAAQSAPRAFAADLAASASWSAGRRELRSIAGPVTIVSGALSAPVRREAAAALVRLLPDARLVEADSGHLVQLEAPAVVADAIRALVA